VNAILCILCTATVGLRVWARRQRKTSLEADDWLLGFALILAWGLFVNLVFAVKYGLGQSYLEVIEQHGSAIGIFKALMALETIYGANLTFVKISILLMYIRIFPTRFIRTSTWVITTILLLWWIIVLFFTIFQCSPIAYAWDKTIVLTNPKAHCLNANEFYIGNAVPNIVTDLAILSLPVHEVWRLHMRTGQKAAVMGMFLLGGLVVVISIVRLISLFSLDLNSPDVTRHLTVPWIYTSIEPCIAIICACLPTFRPLISLFSSAFKSATSNSGTSNAQSKVKNPRIFRSGGSFEPLGEGGPKTGIESLVFTPKTDTFVEANGGKKVHRSASTKEVSVVVEEFPMQVMARTNSVV